VLKHPSTQLAPKAVFPRWNWPGRGFGHPPPSGAELKNALNYAMILEHCAYLSTRNFVNIT
jgi:hypothetical protein